MEPGSYKNAGTVVGNKKRLLKRWSAIISEIEKPVIPLLW